jgi:hypothetical protein
MMGRKKFNRYHLAEKYEKRKRKRKREKEKEKEKIGIRRENKCKMGRIKTKRVR